LICLKPFEFQATKMPSRKEQTSCQPTPPHRNPRFPTALNRRQWLLGSADAAVLAKAAPAALAAKTKTQTHIVILGSVLGGIAVANRLHTLLEWAKMTKTLATARRQRPALAEDPAKRVVKPAGLPKPRLAELIAPAGAHAS
jgi:hypothetical protein